MLWVSFVIGSAMACVPGQPPTLRAPLAATSSHVDRCPSDSLKRECGGFRKSGFVEAYVRFFYATPRQLEGAYPLASSMAGPNPTEEPIRSEQSAELLLSLRRLECFSITAQELEALAVVLAELKRERRPTQTPQGDSRFPSKLEEVRSYPSACTAVYELPSQWVDQLRQVQDTALLGHRWTAAVLASGPCVWALAPEPGEAKPATDPRSDAAEWTTIGRDLVEFSKLRCGGEQLYVEIGFDC